MNRDLFPLVSYLILSGFIAYWVGPLIKKVLNYLRTQSELPEVDRPVTRVLGVVEATFFAAVFIFLSFNYSTEIKEIADRIFLVTTAWIGLKTLGYKPDDRSKADRKNSRKESDQDQTATRYVFLLGSFMNIGFGLLMGWIITRLLS